MCIYLSRVFQYIRTNKYKERSNKHYVVQTAAAKMFLVFLAVGILSSMCTYYSYVPISKPAVYGTTNLQNSGASMSKKHFSYPSMISCHQFLSCLHSDKKTKSKLLTPSVRREVKGLSELLLLCLLQHFSDIHFLEDNYRQKIGDGPP